MKNLKMFCISLEPNHYDFIKSLGYEPVGLGDKNFNEKWFRDRLSRDGHNPADYDPPQAGKFD